MLYYEPMNETYYIEVIKETDYYTVTWARNADPEFYGAIIGFATREEAEACVAEYGHDIENY